MTYNLLLGDCLEQLKTLPNCSVDSIVTDPPYGISFMNRKWDYDVPSVEIWKECLRVLKPGGHLLSFAGTRTQHRMAINIEDAGFEIRDMLAWVYAVGMPKSLDVSKAINKAAGAERPIIGKHPNPAGNKSGGNSLNMSVVGMPTEATLTSPATPEAQQWQGWGTALKPALEPVTMARKPIEGTVANTVLTYGTGAINIDGCRVEGDLPTACKAPGWAAQNKTNAELGYRPSDYYKEQEGFEWQPNTQGRWPANLIHSGEDEVVSLFPDVKSGQSNGNAALGETGNTTPFRRGNLISRNDSGSAARFFYCAKASKSERGENNNHPTVKPIKLLQYLCRLVTQPDRIVLDPFMGSGTTGIAALKENFNFIGVEREKGYFKIAQTRISNEESSSIGPLDQISACL